MASWRPGALAFVLVVVGCSSSGAGPGAPAGADAGGVDDGAASSDATLYSSAPNVVHTYAPTFDAVYGEILSPTCATAFCHGVPGDFLDMSTRDAGYAALVGVTADGRGCGDSGLVRVNPGHPESSLMYMKVTGPPCGARMPAYAYPLDPREVAQIHDWISTGASP